MNDVEAIQVAVSSYERGWRDASKCYLSMAESGANLGMLKMVFKMHANPKDGDEED